MPASPTALAYLLITPINHAGLHLLTKTTHPRPTPPATPDVPANPLSPSPRPTTTGHHLPMKINYDHHNHADLYLPTKTTHPRPTPPATTTVPANQLSTSPRPTTTGHHLPTKINYDHHNHTRERWMLLLLRAFHTVGSDDSATWASAMANEFALVPRVCRLILAVYEEDLCNPQFPPAHDGYRLNPDWVVKRVTYE
ncbi:hypothetical protein RJ640_000609 [Escallonia rubra]|uniref:Mono-/di-acylglycerol lipase N-terminal domain-containing protein n=1 Tax=Escallonia rubra TaxID=112253 RepID=A0AA88U475_9ASTE|nr:hypothetical protein RJ640_000609 [Escallonia rubra]